MKHHLRRPARAERHQVRAILHDLDITDDYEEEMESRLHHEHAASPHLVAIHERPADDVQSAKELS